MKKGEGNRACVGIIYSHSKDQSNESKLLAHYLCGLLVSSGYCRVYLIGLPTGKDSGGSCDYPSTLRIKYSVNGKIVEASASDMEYAHWSSLQECHVVIVTVNTCDTTSCGERLIQAMQDRKSVPIFSLQRGVKNSSVLKDTLETNTLTVIEGFAGFGVVVNPATQALTPTVNGPAIMIERLTKEIEKFCVGPLNLLETMKLEIYYRKTLTPFAWGVLIYESLYYINAINGGTLQDTILKGNCRQALVMMLRECRQTLFKAARGGEWKPDMMLVTSLLSPFMLEMVLCIPWPFFQIVLTLFGIFPPNIPSPCQVDLAEKRKTSVDWMLGDLIETGERYKMPMDICKAVFNKIKDLEKSIESGILRDKDRGFQDIDNAISEYARANHGMIPSYREFYGVFVKMLMGFLFALGLLYVLIVLDW